MNQTDVSMPSSSADPAIRVERKGSVGEIAIANAARHNALTFSMWRQIPGAIATLDTDPDIRAIILTGADSGAFASGADISEFDTVRADAETSRGYEQANADAFAAIRAASKPVIAVIRKYCIGGGIGLAAACDIRLAADDAVFAIPAARLGLAYPPEAVADIVALIGPARTRDLFFTARKIDAATALRIGLIDDVVPLSDLDRFATDYVAGVTSLAPLTHRAIKSAIRAAVGTGSMETARQEANACFDSADYAEGRAAFKARRNPVFTGI